VFILIKCNLRNLAHMKMFPEQLRKQVSSAPGRSHWILLAYHEPELRVTVLLTSTPICTAFFLSPLFFCHDTYNECNIHETPLPRKGWVLGYHIGFQRQIGIKNAIMWPALQMANAGQGSPQKQTLPRKFKNICILRSFPFTNLKITSKQVCNRSLEVTCNPAKTTLAE
jgi:hypothetical protein